jgi:hypothetical protein
MHASDEACDIANLAVSGAMLGPGGMRYPVLTLAGLLVVLIAAGSTAQSYFKQPPAPPAVPYYVNGQPLMSDPNPADSGPEEKAARRPPHRA